MLALTEQRSIRRNVLIPSLNSFKRKRQRKKGEGSKRWRGGCATPPAQIGSSLSSVLSSSTSVSAASGVGERAAAASALGVETIPNDQENSRALIHFCQVWQNFARFQLIFLGISAKYIDPPGNYPGFPAARAKIAVNMSAKNNYSVRDENQK